MAGWHHRLDGHESEQASGVGDGQGGLVCCSPWGCEELDTTERVNQTMEKYSIFGKHLNEFSHSEHASPDSELGHPSVPEAPPGPPSNEYSGLISFRRDWLDLLAVHGTLKSLLQHHNLKASILWPSALFMVHLSHPSLAAGF